jgi:hypothetical protein
MEHQWNEIQRGKRTTRRKTCPNATLSTTNPTWTDPGSNPGLRSGRPATDRLSHGTAIPLHVNYVGSWSWCTQYKTPNSCPVKFFSSLSFDSIILDLRWPLFCFKVQKVGGNLMTSLWMGETRMTEAAVKDETVGFLCLHQHTECSKSRFPDTKLWYRFWRIVTRVKPSLNLLKCFFMLPFRFHPFQHCDPKFRINFAIEYSQINFIKHVLLCKATFGTFCISNLITQ